MKRIIMSLLVVVLVIGMTAALVSAATTVTVTDTAGLNIRKEPSAGSEKVGSLAHGAQVTVLATQTLDGYVWGQIDNGWIRLDFTDYQASTQPSVPNASGTWKKESGNWYYYIGGNKATGWIKDADIWYYLDGSGIMQTGWQKIDNKWYFFNKSGAMQTGWLSDGGIWYYLNGNGAMQTGWANVNGSWYYMNGSGAMQIGWLYINNVWYYMNSSGAMQTGWVRINDDWYYMNSNGAMQTGWVQQGAACYYLQSNGVMQKGWLQLEDKRYYLDSAGVMAVGKVKIDGQAHKFGMDGVWQGETQNAFSTDAMAILKLEEGFSKKPYWDYSQWTVGYGTECPADMLESYKANGISEAEAEILLREHIAKTEAEIDKFIAKYSLTLSQGQYDAIVLFSYNCGAGWCNDVNGTFHNAIKNQVSGNDLIHAFSLWCTAGGEIKDFLVRRRLSEANMYLNGEYSQTPPENFCFVTFDANGGTISPRCQGYDALLDSKPYPVPTYTGYTFDGWYTEKSGGTKVDVLDTSHNKTTLYARWSNANQNNQTQTGIQNVTVTVTSDAVNLRKDPYVDNVNNNKHATKPQVNKGEKFTLTEYAVEQYSGGTRRWGKFTEYGGGWVCLEYTDYDTVKSQLTNVSLVQKDGKTYCMLGIEIKTGWQMCNGQWYYADASGIVMTGWVKDGDNWYYLSGSGAMVTGWYLVNKTWYHFGENGTMTVGWLKDGNTWYYLRSNGAMATSWVEDGGKWYYMNAAGAMVTGWLQIGNVWYYLGSDGAMVTGQKTIGPVTYTFAENGVWLG